MKLAALGVSVALLLGVAPQEESEEIRYLRVTPKGTRTECTFTIRRSDAGRTIKSVTERGRTVMTVSARYDGAGMLRDAEVTLKSGDPGKTVKAGVTDGKASVRREGQEAQEFDVPKGVIVTSAPDWTDTFSLCRLYDPRGAKKQEFAGLWVHPTRSAFRLTFTVEKLGGAVIEHQGKKMELHRLALRLRNNSRYQAWADGHGRMIKLVSMPFRDRSTRLVLEGFEESAASLKPE